MRLLRTAVVCAVAACVLAACSSSGGGGFTPPPTSPDTPTVTPTSSPTGTRSDTSSATDALLTAAQVGSGFTTQQYKPSTAPLPCAAAGTPTLNKLVPPRVSVGRAFVSSSAAAGLEEELNVYADGKTSEKALAAGKRGLGCTKGKAYGSDGSAQPVTVSKAHNVTGQLGSGVSEALVWSLKYTSLQAALLVARIGSRLLVLTFAATGSANTSSLPDSLALAKAAVAKVRAHS